MKRIANLQKSMRLRKEGGIFSSYLKFGIPKNQISLKNSAKRSEKSSFSNTF
jgi:hypothetical protein